MNRPYFTPEERLTLAQLTHLMHVAYAESTGMQGNWAPWECLSQERQQFYVSIALRGATARKEAALRPNAERLCTNKEVVRRNAVDNAKIAAWNEHEQVIGKAAAYQLEIINAALTRAGVL